MPTQSRTVRVVRQVWGLLIFLFRSTEIINQNPAMSEVRAFTRLVACAFRRPSRLLPVWVVHKVFLILKEMIYDSGAVTLYMFFVAIATGIALSAGQPPALTPGRPGVSLIEARHWGFAGVWAILG
jgi:hypothetical protein